MQLGLPNWITLSRLLVVPLISYFYLTQRYGWALGLLVYAGFSDLLDGGLARLLHQRTKLGAILDPTADKFLMMVSFVTLVWVQKIPVWLVAMVIARDLYIVVGVWILKLRCKKLYIRPTYLSKMTTFFQLTFISFCFLEAYIPLSSYLWLQQMQNSIHKATYVNLYLVVIFTILSGIHYTLVALAIFRGKPDSVASSFEEEEEKKIAGHPL